MIGSLASRAAWIAGKYEIVSPPACSLSHVALDEVNVSIYPRAPSQSVSTGRGHLDLAAGRTPIRGQGTPAIVLSW